MPKADELHKVPSGYWKIIIVQDQKSPYLIKAVGYIFEQESPGDAKLTDHQASIDDIEARSRLDFLSELPDGIESNVERMKFKSWFD